MIALRLAPLVAVVLAACGGDPDPLDGAPVTAADVVDAADGSDVIAVEATVDVQPARDVVCGPNETPTSSGCACVDGFRPCGGACVDTRTDAQNCGVCGQSCAGASTCVAGACVCRGMVCRGVCTNTTTDPRNCGACEHVCSITFPHSATACIEGVCGFACAPGFADCNIAATDGCETDTTTNAAHCGGCGRVCPRGMTCRGGACG